MRRILALIATGLLCGLATGDLSAARTVHGYTRSNGTYVHGYSTRSSSSHRSHATGGRSEPASRAVHTFQRWLGARATATATPEHGFTVQRDENGRIHRSRAATDEFKREHPCPATGASRGPCRGYVIDHIRPLAIGGADEPANMQWQTRANARAKDKIECNGHACSTH
jgi:hypothetical protein